VFDIGANIGYYTIQFSRVVGRNGKVHSFEPCAYQMDTLERNVKLNSIDNVVTHKLIVSDRDDEVKKIYFSGMANTGSSSLEVKTDDYEQVACITIDKYCMVNDINSVDIVKIDVEGHELSVLKGMQNILGNGSVKHLFLEINNHALSSGQTSGHEIISFLQKFGYMPFSIANGIPEDYERGQSESLVYFCRSH
jgi:FkbM family methyltransferase